MAPAFASASSSSYSMVGCGWLRCMPCKPHGGRGPGECRCVGVAAWARCQPVTRPRSRRSAHVIAHAQVAQEQRILALLPQLDLGALFRGTLDCWRLWIGIRAALLLRIIAATHIQL